MMVTRVHIKSKPTTFEVLVVKIVVGVERFLLANIYRPPADDIVAFLDELTDLEEALCIIGGHPILVGDLNCPGDTPRELNTDVVF